MHLLGKLQNRAFDKIQVRIITKTLARPSTEIVQGNIKSIFI
jgi:hypothetical protein